MSKKAKRAKPTKKARKAANPFNQPPQFLYTALTAAWQKTPAAPEKAIEAGFVLSWGAKGIGFGQITFSQVPQDRPKRPKKPEVRLECHSEAMGADFVKQALDHWISTMHVKD